MEKSRTVKCWRCGKIITHWHLLNGLKVCADDRLCIPPKRGRTNDRTKKIGENTYIFNCCECGKKEAWYGKMSSYRYTLGYAYQRPSGSWGTRKVYCCSWSCYVKGLIKATLAKKELSADDVLFLLERKMEVPWEKVTKVAWQSLPDRYVLEEMLYA